MYIIINMSSSLLSTQFKLKRKTAAAWAASSDILAEGEPGIETDTGRMKIGRTTSNTWANLPYSNNARRDTAANLASVILADGELGYATDTQIMKIGNNANTFSALPTLIDGTSQNTAAASATAAESFKNLAQSFASNASGSAAAAENFISAASLSGAVFADSITAGRGAVSDGQYFWVRPVSGSGVTRFTLFKRTSTAQDTVGSVPSGTEFDNARNDYPRVGGNFITNSIFSLDAADTGLTTTPSGWTFNNNVGANTGTIVTKPNTAIDSKNAFQFPFTGSVTQVQLTQAVPYQIPTHLRGSTNNVRLIYSLQLDGNAAAIANAGSGIVGTAGLLRLPLHITSAVGNGTIVTYTCSGEFPLLAGQSNLAVGGLPTGTGSSLNLTSATIFGVAADKLSFTVANTTVGSSTGSASAFMTGLVSGFTGVQNVTGISGTWQTIVQDQLVPVGWASINPVVRLLTSNGGSPVCTVWVTGICAVLNRQTLLTYDKNISEQITTLATAANSTAITAATTAANSATTAANTANATATALATSEQITAPWNIGTNIAPNSLLDADANGTVGPTGYQILSGGGTTAASQVTSCPITPFNTNRAWRSTHYNITGTGYTDIQLGISIPVPLPLQTIAFTMRVVYYVLREDNRIITTMVTPYRNGSSSSGTSEQTGITLTKQSTDSPTSNTWYPVVHTATISASGATTTLYVRLVRLQASSPHWAGSPASAFAWVTGLSYGFNRTNTTYDRNLTSEITTIATATANAINASNVNARTAMNSADQYVDANGFMSPVVPIETIVAWGDSLTAAGYITTVQSSFSASGSTRTVVNNGIGGESSTQILNRINGYSFLARSGSTTANQEVTLVARRTQPPRMNISGIYINQWTTYGATIAEPRFVNFYTNGTLIGTSYTRLSAVSVTTSGGSILTTAAVHPFNTGDIVYFTENIAGLTDSTTDRLNISRNKHYFVTRQSDTTYNISTLSGQPVSSFNVSGTVTALGDFTLKWTPTEVIPFSSITTRTYTNRDTSTAVVWMGANNINQVSTVQSDIASAVAHLKTLGKRVLILTPIIAIGTSSNEYILANPSTLNIAESPFTSVSTEVTNRKTIGDWILNTYPNNSIDVWSILRANRDVSNSGDTADLAAGGTPRTLRTDLIHLTGTGYGYVANAVYARLSSNNW